MPNFTKHLNDSPYSIGFAQFVCHPKVPLFAAITTYPDLWAAAVDIVGVANFVTFLENTSPWRRKLREAEYGSLEHDREFLEQISPIRRPIEHGGLIR